MIVLARERYVEGRGACIICIWNVDAWGLWAHIVPLQPLQAERDLLTLCVLGVLCCTPQVPDLENSIVCTLLLPWHCGWVEGGGGAGENAVEVFVGQG